MRFLFFSLALAFAFLTFCGHYICAQTESDENLAGDNVVIEEEDDETADEIEEDIELQEVEIEASKPSDDGFKDEPGTVQIIGIEEIEKSGAEDLLDLLRRKVGMNESDVFGGTSVGLLGLPAKFTLVLLDGKRITGRVFEQLDFNQIPLSAVERIEIIKGPSSTIHGSAAIGGVINVVTRNPKQGISGSIRFKSGTNGLDSEGLGFGWREGTASALFDFERFLYDGFDLDPRTIDTDGDSEKKFNAFSKIKFGFSPKSRFAFTAFRFNENRKSIRFAPPDITRQGGTKTRRLLLSAEFEWDLKPGETLRFAVQEGNYAHSYSSFFVGFPDTLSMTSFTEGSRDYSLNYFHFGDRNILTAGIERLTDEIDSDRISTGAANYGTNVFFVQNEYKAAPNLTFTFGGRIDDNSSYGTHFSPRAGFKFDKSDSLVIRGSIARGFRPPGLRELYFDFNSPFGYRVEGSAELLPEKSTGMQLSFDWRPTSEDQITAIVFRNEVTNLIEAVEVTQSPWVFRMTNIEDALSQGAEFGWGRRLSQYWTLSMNTVYVEAEDQSTGNRLPNSPKWDHRGSINFARDEWKAEAFVRRTGNRYTDLANAVEAPEFTTVDLHFGYSPGDWDFKLHLLNVLDEVDRRYGPKPGFEWQAEAVFNF